jgi:uncharacterized protein YpmS
MTKSMEDVMKTVKTTLIVLATLVVVFAVVAGLWSLPWSSTQRQIKILNDQTAVNETLGNTTHPDERCSELTMSDIDNPQSDATHEANWNACIRRENRCLAKTGKLCDDNTKH